MKFSALKRVNKRNFLKISATVLIALSLIAVIGVRYWYVVNLRPVDPASQVYQEFVVEQGQSVAGIATELEKDGIIRSKTAFTWYVRGDQAGISLQAGTYNLSPSMSVAVIVSFISEGLVDSSVLTILPAKRLDQTRLEMIESNHWTETEVDNALVFDYDHPVLQDFPRVASLEGYIYPDTYEVNDSTKADDFVRRTLDNLYQKIEERGLIEKLPASGLNLFEAITLASIIEKEAGSNTEKPQIAQVFLKRLELGMQLGSDVTFLYAAAVQGVQPSIDIDSPYNTRVVTGLPPGPISNFDISSLEAVIEPARGDYLYFLAGDDGEIRYATTLAEHQANIKNYCQENCGQP